MTTFVRKDVDDLNVELTCTVPKSDFEASVKKELARIQRNAVIKGFRPGKAPMGMISKMYEKGIIYEIATKQLDKDLADYLQTESIQHLGQPILVDTNFSQQTLAQIPDLDFKYEIGLLPNYTLKGADASYIATRYELDVTDSMIDAEIDNLRKSFGQRDDASIIDASGIIKTTLVELNDDKTTKEGGLVKEESNFVISRMSESLQALFIGKAVGDTVIVEDIKDLEAEMDRERINSWILGVDSSQEINAHFAATITDIKTMQPAALDTALFDKAFGEGSNITDEASLREHFSFLIKNEYHNVSLQLLLNEIFLNVKRENDFALPETFLRKFIRLNDDAASEEKLDRDWDNILADVRWSIIKSDIVQQENIRVTEADIAETFRMEVARYFGQYANDQLIESTITRLMQNKEEVQKRHDSIMTDRVLLAVVNKITINIEVISKEDFNEKIAAVNKKQEQEVEA